MLNIFRQWLHIGEVDNEVIELSVATANIWTAAGRLSRQKVGTRRSTWKVETGICTCEWVRRTFSLAIRIGESNTPLLWMNYCILGFKKVPVCVLESSKSRGPLCG